MYLAIDNGGSTTRIGRVSNLRLPQFELIQQFSTSQDYAVQIKALLSKCAP